MSMVGTIYFIDFSEINYNINYLKYFSNVSIILNKDSQAIQIQSHTSGNNTNLKPNDFNTMDKLIKTEDWIYTISNQAETFLMESGVYELNEDFFFVNTLYQHMKGGSYRDMYCFSKFGYQWLSVTNGLGKVFYISLQGNSYLGLFNWISSRKKKEALESENTILASEEIVLMEISSEKNIIHFPIPVPITNFNSHNQSDFLKNNSEPFVVKILEENKNFFLSLEQTSPNKNPSEELKFKIPLGEWILNQMK